MRIPSSEVENTLKTVPSMSVFGVSMYTNDIGIFSDSDQSQCTNGLQCRSEFSTSEYSRIRNVYGSDAVRKRP